MTPTLSKCRIMGKRVAAVEREKNACRAKYSILACSVAERAMQSLAEVAEVFLQYLEERRDQAGNDCNDPGSIAVARALSRSEVETTPPKLPSLLMHALSGNGTSDLAGA